MTKSDQQTHWQHVYQTKSTDAVSWYQQSPDLSFSLIKQYANMPNVRLIDIGAGASLLADQLLRDSEQSFDLTVLDISAAALDITRQRLGNAANNVQFIATDILTANLPNQYFDVWHDRAALHFLTSIEQKIAYCEQMSRAVKSGGFAIISTFAEDGPEKCSGLTVQRYSADGLETLFSAHFELVFTTRENHQTPFDTEQTFTYAVLKKR